MKKYICLLIIPAALIYGCDRMEEKKDTAQSTTDGGSPMQLEKPSGVQQNETATGEKTEKSGDMMAVTLQNLAEDSELQLKKDQSETTKKEVIEAHLKAGNYLMFEADLPAKQKYRPALKHFRRVLELDPSNEAAMTNKKQIEDIYVSMGMPIPQ